jgi:hypothetical protein
MNNIASAAFVLLLSSPVFAAPAPEPRGVEARVASVRLKYQETRARQASFTKRETTCEEWTSTEGNSAQVYFDGAEVALVTGTIFGEMGRNEVEYYYLGGKVFFALRREGNYNHPMYLSDAQAGPLKTSWREHRYYFDGDGLVRHTEGTKRSMPSPDVLDAVLTEGRTLHACALRAAKM